MAGAIERKRVSPRPARILYVIWRKNMLDDGEYTQYDTGVKLLKILPILIGVAITIGITVLYFFT